MKKYFLYELKKNAFTIGCLTLIAIIIYALPRLTVNVNTSNAVYEINLAAISTIGGLLAVCVPVWLLNYRMKKRSVDLYYSLPISRTKILTVKLLLGLVAVFIPYTVAYWIGAFIYMAKFKEYINAVYFIPQYFGSLPAIYCIYAMASFAFTRANNLMDGIVFIIFWSCAALLAAAVLNGLTDFKDSGGVSHSIFYSVDYFMPYAPLDLLTTHFTNLLRGSVNVYNYSTTRIINLVLAITITSLLTAGATAGLFITEKHTKAENAEQISESMFGYKTMIPFFTAGLLGLCDFTYGSSMLIIVFVIVGMFLLTVLYKRTIKLGKNQLIIFGASIVAGIVLSILSYI